MKKKVDIVVTGPVITLNN